MHRANFTLIEEQQGFRRSHSPTDHVSLLKETVERKNKIQSRDASSCHTFSDISKRKCRRKVWQRMGSRGCPEGLSSQH
jgi:hypothetical protein